MKEIFNMSTFIANLTDSEEKENQRSNEDDIRSLLELVVSNPNITRKFVQEVDAKLIEDALYMIECFDEYNPPPNSVLADMIQIQRAKNNLSKIKPKKTDKSINLF